MKVVSETKLLIHYAKLLEILSLSLVEENEICINQLQFFSNTS